MSANAAKASKKSRLSVSSLLPRIAIYSAVVAGIIASFYDFKLNKIDLSNDGADSFKAQQFIARINREQQAYYLENNKFNNSDILGKIYLAEPEQTGNYNYQILSSMGPVQTSDNQRETAQFESTIAIARSESSEGKSYIAAVFAFKENGRNIVKTITAICESDRLGVTLIPPTFDGGEIHCPSGTTILSNKNNFDYLRSE